MGWILKATMALRQLIIRKRDEGTTFLISSHILSELQKLLMMSLLLIKVV